MTRFSLRKTCLALGGAVMLTAQPALAQEDDVDPASMENPLAALGQLFAVEPLTEEQEARLPLAQSLVGKILPQGAMKDMLDGMMGGMFGKLMAMGAEGQSDGSFVEEQLGVYGDDSGFALDDAEAKEIADMFDPARKERRKREGEALPALMAEAMGVMEPVMRKAMSELYAIHFDNAELTDIDAFFSTPSGAAYARKSLTMTSDPRILAVTMESMPRMMEQFSKMEERMKALTADLPAKRSFAELSAQEKARISKLTGYPVEELELSTATFDDAAEVAADAAAEATVE